MQRDHAIKLRQLAAYRDEKQLLHPKLDARMIRIELPNAPVLTLLLRLHNVDYSDLSASIGSTRLARNAGSRLAIIAAHKRTTATTKNA